MECARWRIFNDGTNQLKSWDLQRCSSSSHRINYWCIFCCRHLLQKVRERLLQKGVLDLIDSASEIVDVVVCSVHWVYETCNPRSVACASWTLNNQSVWELGPGRNRSVWGGGGRTFFVWNMKHETAQVLNSWILFIENNPENYSQTSQNIALWNRNDPHHHTYSPLTT